MIAANEAASAAKNAVIAVTVPEAASAAASSMISVAVPEAAAGLEETHARWARYDREIAEHEAVRTALTRKYRGRRGRFSSTDQKAGRRRMHSNASYLSSGYYMPIGCVELGGTGLSDAATAAA